MDFATVPVLRNDRAGLHAQEERARVCVVTPAEKLEGKASEDGLPRKRLGHVDIYKASSINYIFILNEV